MQPGDQVPPGGADPGPGHSHPEDQAVDGVAEEGCGGVSDHVQ